MQLNEDPLNRRDAKDAETDPSQSLENLQLKSDWFERPLARAFLCALRVSAVPFCAPRLHRFG